MPEPTGTSSIYDLGYRHYDGERLGRRATFAALYVHALRAAFGIGRRATSKIFPFGLAILAFVPALVQLGVAAITNVGDHDIELFAHEDYFTYVRIVLVLFCAAVAPELVGRDQRNRTLSLYFSRAVTRLDYMLAKGAALVSAMLVLTLGPQAVLFVGNGLAQDDLPEYLSDNADLILPIIGGSLLVSVVIASIGLLVGALVPRRAYATATIVGAFVLTLAAAHIVMESADAAYARFVLLVSPVAWEGAILWLFGVDPDRQTVLAEADLAGWIYLVAMVALVAGALVLTLRRLVKVST